MKSKTTTILSIALIALFAGSVAAPCADGMCVAPLQDQVSQMTASCCSESCPMPASEDCGMGTVQMAQHDLSIVSPSLVRLDTSLVAVPLQAIPTPTFLSSLAASNGDSAVPGPPLITLHSQLLI